MGYELFLAVRNIRARRRRRLTRVTAFVAVAGIAVGVAALIVALALANGFRDEMRDKILRGTAHISVMNSDGGPIVNYEQVRQRLQTVNGVISVSPTTYDGAVLVGPTGTSYAVLRGLEIQSQAAQQELQKLMVEGSNHELFQPREGELRHVVIGVELAARSGLKVGDVAELISAKTSNSSADPIRRFVRVGGIFRTGLYEYDATWIYLALDLASMLTGGGNGSVSIISVQVNDIYNVKPISSEIRKQLGNTFTAIDWQDANQPLFAALALERRIGFVIIGLIVLIAALNITTTLILVVVERRGDIAILGALGATNNSIMSMFLYEGAILGASGAVLGVTLGVACSWLADRYSLISLPADVYSISHVPLHIQIVDVLAAAGIALLLSLVATLYPAKAAAGVRPAKLLRDAG